MYHNLFLKLAYFMKLEAFSDIGNIFFSKLENILTEKWEMSLQKKNSKTT